MPPRLPRRSAVRALTVTTAAASVVAGLLATSAAADARTPQPGTPTGLTVVAATHSGFTIRLKPTTHGRTYRLYASTVKDDLYESALRHQTQRRTFAVATQPRITVTGLPYSTSPYYYRVQVTNGPHWKFSTVSKVGAYLAPSTPSSVGVRRGAGGAPYLNWSGDSASGYRITQSTSSDFSTGVVHYSDRDPAERFTPSAVSPGKTYYYRVQALNGPTSSAISSTVSTSGVPRQQSLRVLTYNLRSTNLPHDPAPWSKRVVNAANLVRSAVPDVIGVQEAMPYDHDHHTQASTLTARLPGYRELDTDSAGGVVNTWTGEHIIYRRSTVTPYGRASHWNLGQDHFGAYSAFRTKSGARFLFVSMHLMTGSGKTSWTERGSETAALLRDARAYAADEGITSLIMVGDTNSFRGRWHNVDTPGNAMRAAGMSDAKLVAQKLYNAQYDSINAYRRKPLTDGHASDHVFCSPGIGVTSWGEQLHVSHGRFVGIIPSDHNAVWTSLTLPIN